VLGASIKLVQQSVSEYTELAEATRRLSAETGLLAKESSGWIQVAQASGVSATTAGRGMGQFLSRVSDLRREQQLGEESTTDFSKALDFLQVSINDGEGNLKSTAQLLDDVNRAFQDLGPGVRSSQVAQDLFGRTGRQLLPILTDQKIALTDYLATLDRFGARLNALNQEEYAEFRRANFELQAAIQGVFNQIATNWIPVLTEVARVASELIGIYAKLTGAAYDTATPHEFLVQELRKLGDFLEWVHDLVIQVTAAYRGLLRFLNPMLSITEKLAAAEEEAAQVRAEAQQALAEQAELEKALREEREKTLEQLDELKGKLLEKLDDIDRDAAQKWEDILVTRMRDAADRSLQNVFKLEDLRQALNDKLDDIDRDFARRWDDILVKRQREALERSIALAQRFEDLARSTAQRRQDVLRSYADREQDQRRETARRVREIEEDAQDRREKLERDHQRRLADIRFDYLDTVTEAARKNDAVAVARAMRERNRELRDEERRFADEQQDLAASLAKKRRDIQEDRQEREADQRRELDRALQRIEENAARQRAEIVRQNQRARDARLRAEAQELEDFNKARAEQEQAAREAYDKSLDELEKANRRAEIVRRIQYERQERDFVLAWQRRISDARRLYAQERDELAAHLNVTGQQLERAYQLWVNQAAAAAAAVARAISTTLAGAGGGQTNLGIIGGRGILSMAEGGVVQASSPTTVLMGDAGPETGIFLPGGSSSMNVNHNFGRMGVDFNGLPGGMNTQQVQSIVYQVMTQVAKGIKVPRT
jgi:hypothetical protein